MSKIKVLEGETLLHASLPAPRGPHLPWPVGDIPPVSSHCLPSTYVSLWVQIPPFL